MIHDFEISPLLIEARRDELRFLYHARSVSIPTSHPRRTALGTLWRRLGQRLRPRRPATLETPLRPSSGVA